MIWTRTLQALSQAIRIRAIGLIQWFIQPAKSCSTLTMTPENSAIFHQHVNKHLLEIKKMQSHFREKGYKINIE